MKALKERKYRVSHVKVIKLYSENKSSVKLQKKNKFVSVVCSVAYKTANFMTLVLLSFKVRWKSH